MTTIKEPWQLYNEQGMPIPGKSGTKDEVFGKGLLHAASHIWMWREQDGHKEILLQKRAAHKNTWPNRYDISAAGHVDLDEEPIDAALREMKEEIGLDARPEQLMLFDVHRAHLRADNGAIENEFQWLYLLKLEDDVPFTLEARELESVVWISIEKFKGECQSDSYVPHGNIYYETLIGALDLAN